MTLFKGMTKRIKPVAAISLYYSGCFDLLRHLQGKRVTILMFHRFSSKKEPFKLPQKVFDRQLSYINRKYNIISFNEYVRVLRGTQERLPPNPLIITIDDGYQDNYEYAYPVLKKYNAPATIFLTTDFISQKAWLWSNRLEYILKSTDKKNFSFLIAGQEKPFQVDSFKGWHTAQLTIFNYFRTVLDVERKALLNELARELGVRVPDEVTDAFLPLTWEQIYEMRSGGIEYGSHTCCHPILSRLSNEELADELNLSKNEIENHINAPVETFCYPNGQPEDITEAVTRQVAQSGYLAAVTTVPGFNQQDSRERYFLKRIAVNTADKVSLARDLTRPTQKN